MKDNAALGVVTGFLASISLLGWRMGAGIRRSAE
jgi:hypothetical protein